MTLITTRISKYWQSVMLSVTNKPYMLSIVTLNFIMLSVVEGYIAQYQDKKGTTLELF